MAFLLFTTTSIEAATLTWNGGAGDGLIATAGNWSPAQAPTTGDLLIFAGSTSLAPQRATALSLGSITFDNTAAAFTLAGAGTYTIGSGGVSNNSTATETINNAVTLGAAQTWTANSGALVFGGAIVNGGFGLTINGGSNTTISSVISGSGALTKTGAGTLTISGTANNTFTGMTTVSAGTLILAKTAGIDALKGALTIGDGVGIDTVRLNAANQFNTGAITINSSGVLDLNNNSTTIGALTMNAGSVTTGTGTLSLGGNVAINANAASATISGNMALGANRTFTVADGAASTDFLISANISGASTITKDGAGTLVLSGTNTFSDLAITAGLVRAQSSGALGNASPVITAGAALWLESPTTISTGTVTINGSGIAGDGAVRNISGDSTLAALTLGSASTLQVDAGSLTVTGTTNTGGTSANTLTITGAGDVNFAGAITNKAALTMNGTGTVTYSGGTNNTAAGDTHVNSGTLLLNKNAGIDAFNGNLFAGDGIGGASSDVVRWMAATQIGSNTNVDLNVLSSGLVDLNNFSDSIKLLYMTGGAITTGTGTLTITGSTVTGNVAGTSATIGGNLALGVNEIFAIADGSVTEDMRINAVVSGAFTLAKTGAGTLVLAGNDTYSGATTVSAGVLNIQNALGLGTTAAGTTVSSGATLQLQGGITVGTETLNVAGAGASGQTGAVANVSGTNNYGGLLTLAAATTLSSDSGTLNLTNVGTITGATFGLTLAGVGNGTISSIIGTTSGTLTKNGAGSWSLLGVNTYTGGTTINAGTLVVNSVSSLGAISGGLTINAGTLEVSTGFTTTRTITLGNAASTFQIDASQTFTDSTAIGGTGSLNKTGAGTMVLGATETYGGSTNVSAGTLQLNASNRIPDASAVNVSGGTLDLQTFTDTVGAVTLSGGSIAGTGTGTLTSSSSYTLQSGSASAILAGSGTVTKNTAGTVTLTGANTLSGNVTVSAGTLSLAAISGSALGSSTAITVNSSGTLLLGASNQINNTASMTLSGGTFAKGNSSEGSANSAGVGALTLTATGSQLDFGTGTIGVLEFASFTANSNLLTIANWTGSANTVGDSTTDRLVFGSDQSANLSAIRFNGYSGTAQIALGGGFYEVVPLTSVPEPATWVGGLLTLIAAGYHHRHRANECKRENRSAERCGPVRSAVDEIASFQPLA